MLLMVEKGIKGGLCHCINRYVKANNKHMKDYDKNTKSLYFKYWDMNNIYGWKMSIQIFMSKSVYLDWSILELSKTVMHKFWYDCVNQKYNEKAKLCYMLTKSVVLQVIG